jgi:hypothetical protein
LRKLEAALVRHLARAGNERTEGRACQRRPHTDAFDSRLGKLVQAKRGARHAHENIHGLADRCTHGPDRFEIA